MRFSGFLRRKRKVSRPPSPMVVPLYIRNWADDPLCGGAFAGQRDALLAHPDFNCSSLQSAWLPRIGGKSIPSELYTCEGGCGVTFWVEGVTTGGYDCPLSWHWYCVCCADKDPSCNCASKEETA